MSDRLRLAILGMTLLSAASTPAHAQAPAGQPPPPPPRFEASGQFTFLNATGNSDVRSIGAGGDFTSRPDPWIYNGKILFAETADEGELTARTFVGLFRGSRALNPRLSAYGQYDFLRDTFSGIEQRHIEEGGVAYLVVDRPRQRLRVDGGVGYLYEARPEPEDHFDSATASTGALYKFTFSPTSDFTFEPRAILPFAESAGWKYEQLATLNAALNTIFSLKVTHTIRYSGQPPATFKKTDTIGAVSIVAKIRRQ
jgi:putative salt-induced outer membrane protein YdiY